MTPPVKVMSVIVLMRPGKLYRRKPRTFFGSRFALVSYYPRKVRGKSSLQCCHKMIEASRMFIHSAPVQYLHNPLFTTMQTA